MITRCGGKRLGAGLALLAFVASAVPSLPARAVTPEEVDAAIKKAQAYLHGRQKNGNWEIVDKPKAEGIGPDAKNFGGYTAIATYALLASGENPQSPDIKAAVAWLLKCPM